MSRVDSAGMVTTRNIGAYRDVRVVGTFACDYCNNHSLAYQETREEDVMRVDLDEWLASMDEHLTWLPTGVAKPPDFPDVPTEIAEAAQEAHQCLGIGAFRAAVVLARSVIEATAKAKGITSGRLVDKIDKMFDQHLIREHIKDGAHEVRYLGNEMAHGDFVDPVSGGDSRLVMTIMAEVLDEVFQSPARVDRAKAARAGKAQPTSGP